MHISKLCKVQNKQILLTPLGKAYSPRTVALSRVLVVNGTLGVSLGKQNQRCTVGTDQVPAQVLMGTHSA